MTRLPTYQKNQMTLPSTSLSGFTCIIPAKALDQSKTRLSPILSLAQRVDLSIALLLRTVDVALSVFRNVTVVSGDDRLSDPIKARGARWLKERHHGLNSALTLACSDAVQKGTTAVLVIPSDLPLLTAGDLRALFALAQTPPHVVIAPCHDDSGTNALLMTPPGLIAFQFGTNSFQRHCDAARQRGLQPAIYRSSTIAFDLDTPQDWQLIHALRGDDTLWPAPK